jgi:hypothetical protein
MWGRDHVGQRERSSARRPAIEHVEPPADDARINACRAPLVDDAARGIDEVGWASCAKPCVVNIPRPMPRQ